MVLSDLDRALLARCLSGADGAWEDFVDRFIALITHVVSSTGKLRLGQIPDQWRDDIVAEVLLTLVDNDFAVLRQFRGQSSLGTYLVVVSRRVAVRKLSKMKIRPKQFKQEPSDKHSSDSFQFENTEEVHSLLKKMPESEATMIRMFHLEHRSYSEIGNALGVPENSVGPMLSKARDRMRTLGS